MKVQQVKVDYWTMLKTSGTYFCLALSGWILFKLVRAVFLFPAYLEKNGHRLQKNLEHKYKEYLISSNLQETAQMEGSKLEEEKIVPKETKKKK